MSVATQIMSNPCSAMALDPPLPAVNMPHFFPAFLAAAKILPMAATNSGGGTALIKGCPMLFAAKGLVKNV